MRCMRSQRRGKAGATLGDDLSDIRRSSVLIGAPFFFTRRRGERGEDFVRYSFLPVGIND